MAESRTSRIEAALRAYRCQHTRDFDGDGLPLLDILSPGETVAEGNAEIELLADHISAALAEEDGEPKPRKCVHPNRKVPCPTFVSRGTCDGCQYHEALAKEASQRQAGECLCSGNTYVLLKQAPPATKETKP